MIKKTETFFPYRLVLLAFLSLNSPNLFARGHTWDDASNGENSFKSLEEDREHPNDFYVNVKMNPIAGAKLVLFNYEAAKRLGLEIPESQAALEKMILDRFAYFVSPLSGTSPEIDAVVLEHLDTTRPVKTLFASRYQDSLMKGDGEAQGDGRSVWSGELHYSDPSGKRHSQADVSLKGIGPTQLAWLKHKDPGHRDGLQSLTDAVNSFSLSEANNRNQLATSVDLAVIRLPFNKKVTITDADGSERIEEIPAAITIRAGNNLRQAHFLQHSDNPKNFKKLFDYALKKDMGLSLDDDERPTLEQVNAYLNSIAENFAEDAARYLDLHLLQSAPTSGNRTSNGTGTDTESFAYLRGHIGNYNPAGKDFASDRTLAAQKDRFKKFSRYLVGFMKKAGYSPADKPLPADLDKYKQELEARFEETFKRRISELRLMRLGFSSDEIEDISKNCANQIEKFNGQVETVSKIAIQTPQDYNDSDDDRDAHVPEKIRFAKYSIRNVLADTFRVYAIRYNDVDKPKKAPTAWARSQWPSLFSSSRYPLRRGNYAYEPVEPGLMEGYKKSVENLVECSDRNLLAAFNSPDLNLYEFNQSRKTRKAKAQLEKAQALVRIRALNEERKHRAAGFNRADRTTHFQFAQDTYKFAHEIEDFIQPRYQGHGSFQSVSGEMMAEIERHLVDRGLPSRKHAVTSPEAAFLAPKVLPRAHPLGTSLGSSLVETSKGSCSSDRSSTQPLTPTSRESIESLTPIERELVTPTQ